jgi:hypothetical protein
LTSHESLACGSNGSTKSGSRSRFGVRGSRFAVGREVESGVFKAPAYWKPELATGN